MSTAVATAERVRSDLGARKWRVACPQCNGVWELWSIRDPTVGMLNERRHTCPSGCGRVYPVLAPSKRCVSCGGALNRYNRGEECGPCGRRETRRREKKALESDRLALRKVDWLTLRALAKRTATIWELMLAVKASHPAIQGALDRLHEHGLIEPDGAGWKAAGYDLEQRFILAAMPSDTYVMAHLLGWPTTRVARHLAWMANRGELVRDHDHKGVTIRYRRPSARLN